MNCLFWAHSIHLRRRSSRLSSVLRSYSTWRKKWTACLKGLGSQNNEWKRNNDCVNVPKCVSSKLKRGCENAAARVAWWSPYQYVLAVQEGTTQTTQRDATNANITIPSQAPSFVPSSSIGNRITQRVLLHCLAISLLNEIINWCIVWTSFNYATFNYHTPITFITSAKPGLLEPLWDSLPKRGGRGGQSNYIK